MTFLRAQSGNSSTTSSAACLTQDQSLQAASILGQWVLRGSRDSGAAPAPTPAVQLGGWEAAQPF